MELHKAELVDKLAQHRTDNAEEADLLRMYYDVTYQSLDEQFTEEELRDIVEQEVHDD